MKRRMFIPILMLSLLAGSSAPILSAKARMPKYAPVAVQEYHIKYNINLATSYSDGVWSQDDTVYQSLSPDIRMSYEIDLDYVTLKFTHLVLSFVLEDVTITYSAVPYTNFSAGYGLYDFTAYTDITGGEILTATYTTLYTDYSMGFDDGASSQSEVDASSYGSLITSAYDSGFTAGGNQTGIVINDGFLCIAAVVLFAIGCFFAWRTETSWLFAVSGLLWFVPIFLISNLFVIIFSIVMIVFSFMLTFLKA